MQDGQWKVINENCITAIRQIPGAAVKVSTIVRTFGHAHTEIWPATEWKRFKELVHDLAGGR